jgi:excisionase family DNA binding protein
MIGLVIDMEVKMHQESEAIDALADMLERLWALLSLPLLLCSVRIKYPHPKFDAGSPVLWQSFSITRQRTPLFALTCPAVGSTLRRVNRSDIEMGRRHQNANDEVTAANASSASDHIERASIPFAQRLTCTIAEASQATGLGRTKIYELIAEGRVATTTVGRRRLVLIRSLYSLVGMTDSSGALSPH